MIQNKYFYQLFKARFQGIRNELLILLALSIISILLNQFWINKISAFNDFQYNIGTIWIKLCYSYLSSFIFYYLVVYSPKERKRTKAYRVINNKIHKINELVTEILSLKNEESGDNNAEFLEFKISFLQSEVQQLIIINDLLSDEMFLNLNNLNDVLSRRLHNYNEFSFRKDFGINLRDLDFERKELYKNFYSEFFKKYDFLYHYHERKRNKIY